MPELFWHPSTLHGQAHVTRVMVHAIRLIDATGQQHLGPQLWAAVFLHDLARPHDGVCHRHGADAARRQREGHALRQRVSPTAANHLGEDSAPILSSRSDRSTFAPCPIASNRYGLTARAILPGRAKKCGIADAFSAPIDRLARK